MKRTDAQNRRLYGLMHKLGIDADIRMDLVRQFTDGRTGSSAELTIGEANNLIGYLAHMVQTKMSGTDLRTDRLRKTLISFVYQLPAGFGFYQQTGDKMHFNGAAFDAFLMTNKHSPYPGKHLNQLNIKELTRLIAIMKQWVEYYSKQ
jgi:hypothetical protein